MENLSGGNCIVEKTRLGWGRHRTVGLGSDAFLECAASLQLGRNIPFPLCPEPQRKSEITLQGDWDTGISAPCWGKASGSSKGSLGLAQLCTPSASLPCSRAPASWAGGRTVGRGQGSHSLHQLPGFGPAQSLSGLCAGGDQLHDGAASSSMCELLQRSALSSLPLHSLALCRGRAVSLPPRLLQQN